jgi:hypothetical protein
MIDFLIIQFWSIKILIQVAVVLRGDAVVLRAQHLVPGALKASEAIPDAYEDAHFRRQMLKAMVVASDGESTSGSRPAIPRPVHPASA